MVYGGIFGYMSHVYIVLSQSKTKLYPQSCKQSSSVQKVCRMFCSCIFYIFKKNAVFTVRKQDIFYGNFEN